MQYRAYVKAHVIHVAFGNEKIRISVPEVSKRMTSELRIRKDITDAAINIVSKDALDTSSLTSCDNDSRSLPSNVFVRGQDRCNSFEDECRKFRTFEIL